MFGPEDNIKGFEPGGDGGHDYETPKNKSGYLKPEESLSHGRGGDKDLEGKDLEKIVPQAEGVSALEPIKKNSDNPLKDMSDLEMREAMINLEDKVQQSNPFNKGTKRLTQEELNKIMGFDEEAGGEKVA